MSGKAGKTTNDDYSEFSVETADEQTARDSCRNSAKE